MLLGSASNPPQVGMPGRIKNERPGARAPGRFLVAIVEDRAAASVDRQPEPTAFGGLTPHPGAERGGPFAPPSG